MDESRKTTNKENIDSIYIQEPDSKREGTSIDGFEKIDHNYSPKASIENTLKSFFPFSTNEKASILGNVAFCITAIFFLLPVFECICAFFIPNYISSIATHTKEAMELISYVLIAFLAWALLGTLSGIIYFKNNPFLKYKNFFDFLKTNSIKCSLIVVFIIMTISSLFSSNVDNSFSNVTDGVFVWLRILGGCICVSLINKPVHKRILLAMFVLSAVFMSALVYYQYVTQYRCISINEIFSVDMSLIDSPEMKIRLMRGIFANSNHCGYYLVLGALAAAGLIISSNCIWKKIIYGIAFAIILNVTVINDTMGSVLAVALLVLLIPIAYINSKHCIFVRFVPLIITILIFVSISLYPSLPNGSKNIIKYTKEFSSIFSNMLNKENGDLDKTNDTANFNATDNNNELTEYNNNQEKWWLNNQEVGTYRLGLWQYGIELIRYKPILGYGCNGAAELFEKESGLEEPALRVHNEFLQIALDYGIPALLIYLFSLITTVFYFFRNLLNNKSSDNTRILFVMFAGYCISSFFGIAAYYTVSYFFFIFMLLISEFEGKKAIDISLCSNDEADLYVHNNSNNINTDHNYTSEIEIKNHDNESDKD